MQIYNKVNSNYNNTELKKCDLCKFLTDLCKFYIAYPRNFVIS